MNNSQTISFWDFLLGHSIEIPIIQRDYAQGRRGKEELRKGFLANLKAALDDKSTVLKLDFVYGASKKKQLNPLDGQQRLTTLWLLHWYIALRANVLGECCETLRKFTYETRISSRDFCEQLCNADNFRNFGGDDVVGYIKRQTWFYSAWKQDPTIQSMLRMLSGTYGSEAQEDGIEKVFGSTNFEEYWNLLCSNDCPIQFYYLPLENFGLSDDLYIKMNARGKQLTSFENFKADFIGYITEQAKCSSPEWNGLLNPTSGLPVKMDSVWTDIFWEEKANDYRIDEIYFAFINRFFWNELFTGKKDGIYILDIGKGDENTNSSYKYLNDSDNSNDYDTRIAYEGLGKYRYLDGEIPFKTFEKLNKVLDNYLEIRCCRCMGAPIIPECPWDHDFEFIPSYIKDEETDENIVVKNNSNESIYQITYLNQVHRVVFYAVCKFLNEYNAGPGAMYYQLERWMRVVWNLVSSEGIDGRPIIRSTQAMRAAMELIQKLDVQDVYASLVNLKDNEEGATDVVNRLKEEIIKAEKINEDLNWEQKLKDAEKLFKGGIRFLYHNENDEEVDWDNFDVKFNAVKKYLDFDKNRIKDEYKVKFIKAFVFQNPIDDICDKELFNPKLSTWNWVLNNSAYAKSVHVLLTEDLDNIKPLNGDGCDITPSVDWPFDFMVDNYMFGGRGRFRRVANVWAFYRPYGQKALLLDQKDFARNRLLRLLLEHDKVQISNIGIEGGNFFPDWDIKFRYGEYALIWKHDNKIYFGEHCADANGISELEELIQRIKNGIGEMNAL